MARKHFPKTSTIPLWLMNRRQRNQKRTRYKVKLTLSEQKTVNITKNGEIITIQVRSRSEYFTDR